MARRTETTEYLKGCVADALIELMETTPLEKIKVQDITDRAGVGRVTYFRYFESKTDILSFKLMTLWYSWIDKYPYPQKVGDYEHALWFFSFCYSIRPLLAILLKQGKHIILLDVFLRCITGIVPEAGRKRYLKMFTAFGLLGIVTEWIGSDFKETPEELAGLLL